MGSCNVFKRQDEFEVNGLIFKKLFGSTFESSHINAAGEAIEIRIAEWGKSFKFPQVDEGVVLLIISEKAQENIMRECTYLYYNWRGELYDMNSGGKGISTDGLAWYAEMVNCYLEIQKAKDQLRK